MSSHHIVREKQEPALLIAGLDNFPDELLGQLLEWSPTVIVTIDTAEQVQAFGIKIDWLLGDEMPELQQSDIKLMPVGWDTSVVAAVNYLIAQGYPAVNVITDEFAPGEFDPFVDKIDLVVFYDKKKIVAVHSGFSKWKPAGERIEILTQPHNFLYTGLSPITDNVYETTHDGFFTLQFSNAYLLIAEGLD
jgi:thiamine pyrophosphokinase